MGLTRYLRSAYYPEKLNLRPRTKEYMEFVVNHFERFTGRQLKPSDLNKSTISAYLLHLIESGRRPKTVKTRRGCLLTLWKFAFARGDNATDPSQHRVPMPLLTKKKPRCWSMAQVNIMLDQASRTFPRINRWFGQKHWTALILLLYYTGIRIAALLQLRRTALQGHMLYVQADIQKDREEQVIPLPDHLVNMLVSLPRPRIQSRCGRNVSEHLIPWPWSFRHPTEQFRRYIIRPAGLPDQSDLKLHAFRRMVATIIEATSGIDAARDVLGHASVATTKLYLVERELVDPTLPTRANPLRTLPPLGDVG